MQQVAVAQNGCQVGVDHLFNQKEVGKAAKAKLRERNSCRVVIIATIQVRWGHREVNSLPPAKQFDCSTVTANYRGLQRKKLKMSNATYSTVSSGA